MRQEGGGERSASSVAFQLLVVAGLACVIFRAPVAAQFQVPPPPFCFSQGGDYRIHIRLASEFAETGRTTVPHCLYHVLLNGARSAWSGLSYRSASIAVCSLASAGLAVGVYVLLCSQIGSRPNWQRRMLCAGATFGVTLAGPVALLMPVDGHMYLGYIHPNPYHNPTYMLLRPFAVVLSVCVAWAFAGTESRASWLVVLATALLTVLATAAKPSYTICLLPAAFLVTVWRLGRRQPVDWRLLGLGLAVPAVVLLAWQYSLTYTTGSHGIMFAPFAFYSLRSAWLLPKFALSILFPACVLCCYFGQVRRDPYLVLAWVGFAIGGFYSYFLAEQGPRLSHGNFAWCGQVTLLVLFVASIAFLVRTVFGGAEQGTRRGALRLCLAAFGLHVLGGLAYYGMIVMVVQYRVQG